MALSPLIVFLILYLVTSIVTGDFYRVPITVAFLVSAIFAILIAKGSINKRVEVFSKGAGNKNTMLMLWIFLLAGAFASSAKTMGAVDSTVNLTLTLLPHSLLLPGLFIAACFISLAIGTSVGTIAALTPVAVGIASQSNLEVPFCVAIIVGGAYFGDNLSFISDTTIVATQTQECRMSDKFNVNSRIVIPVAILMMMLYFFLGKNVEMPADIPSVTIAKVVPYLAVVVLAVCGLNVMLVLLIGLVLSGVVGLAYGEYDMFGWFQAMAEGMMGMSELIIMTLLASGMLAMIRNAGGIEYLISIITGNISGKRGAEFSIAALTSLVNICTANNTVAIITSGPIAKDIAARFALDKRKCASILDTASCFTQGLLPYGAQMLIATGLINSTLGTEATFSPINILEYLYYPMAVGVVLMLSIVFRYPRKYS